jgi:hypothetical protein
MSVVMVVLQLILMRQVHRIEFKDREQVGWPIPHLMIVSILLEDQKVLVGRRDPKWIQEPKWVQEGLKIKVLIIASKWMCA